MQAQCSDLQLEFQPLSGRRVVVDDTGGRVTSDAGLLLLREIAERGALLSRFGACFDDYRDQDRIEFSVGDLVSQRVLGIAAGYEDLNDHESLRGDALFATAVGRVDPTGEDRERQRDRGNALAGKSTLNRIEAATSDAGPDSRYKKIVYRETDIDHLLVDVLLEAYAKAPDRIVLDLDATDDPLYGKQEGRFFHGYYRHYCYLPLYITCGDFLLCARLRPSNIDGAAGSLEEVQRIVGQIRACWPDVEIIIRADSGFARDYLMTWCEEHDAHYVLGLARNNRLVSMIEPELEAMREQQEHTGEPAKTYKEFEYRTHKTWTRARRVVGKAEHLPGKSNPRFVVTNLSHDDFDARELYEDLYCARGDMENRIKEQQLDLYADRTSCHSIGANQLRLYFASMAYVLLNELRRVGLQNTAMERAQCGTIRTRLIKVGAVVKVSVRRVHVALSGVYPLKGLWVQIHQNLQRYQPLLT